MFCKSDFQCYTSTDDAQYRATYILYHRWKNPLFLFIDVYRQTQRKDFAAVSLVSKTISIDWLETYWTTHHLITTQEQYIIFIKTP